MLKIVSVLVAVALLAAAGLGYYLYLDENDHKGYPYNIYYYDVRNDTLVQLTYDDHPQVNPSTNGRIVAWTDCRNSYLSDCVFLGDSNIFYMNLESREVQQLSFSTKPDYSPVVGENTIAWLTYEDAYNKSDLAKVVANWTVNLYYLQNQTHITLGPYSMFVPYFIQVGPYLHWFEESMEGHQMMYMINTHASAPEIYSTPDFEPYRAPFFVYYRDRILITGWNLSTDPEQLLIYEINLTDNQIHFELLYNITPPSYGGHDRKWDLLYAFNETSLLLLGNQDNEIETYLYVFNSVNETMVPYHYQPPQFPSGEDFIVGERDGPWYRWRETYYASSNNTYPGSYFTIINFQTGNKYTIPMSIFGTKAMVRAHPSLSDGQGDIADGIMVFHA